MCLASSYYPRRVVGWPQGSTVMSCGGRQPHGLIVADTKGCWAIQEGMDQQLKVAPGVLRVLPSAATCCAGSSKVTRRKRQQQQRGLTQQRAPPPALLLLLPTALLHQLWRAQPQLWLQAQQLLGQQQPAPAAVQQRPTAGQYWKLELRWWLNTGSATRRSRIQHQQQQQHPAVAASMLLVAAAQTRVCLLLSHQSLQQLPRSALQSARPTTACPRPARCQQAGWR